MESFLTKLSCICVMKRANEAGSQGSMNNSLPVKFNFCSAVKVNQRGQIRVRSLASGRNRPKMSSALSALIHPCIHPSMAVVVVAGGFWGLTQLGERWCTSWICPSDYLDFNTLLHKKKILKYKHKIVREPPELVMVIFFVKC